MELLLFLAMLAGIAIFVAIFGLNYYIAKQFETVANQKGHHGERFFHLCFWLGFVGYLLVIALPDRCSLYKKVNEENEYGNLVTAEALRQLKREDEMYSKMLDEFKPCKKCGADISQDGNVCHVCGVNLSK